MPLCFSVVILSVIKLSDYRRTVATFDKEATLMEIKKLNTTNKHNNEFLKLICLFFIISYKRIANMVQRLYLHHKTFNSRN
jgi:hypothetical protein